jgi:type II secretory pathway component PulJ
LTRRSREAGYLLVDLIVGLGLFSFVLLFIYHVYGPTFALYQHINGQLAAQQDVRLTLDRVARGLREASTAYGRLRLYPPQAGCGGAYEGCIAFVTARDGNCTGTFQLIDGAPNWQATLYLWRDTASSELRLRCDPETTFPAVRWPPQALAPFTVIGTHVVAASVALTPVESPRPSAIAITLQEQAPTSSRLAPPILLNETIFLPQNR